jgi:hypothetical protein
MHLHRSSPSTFIVALFLALPSCTGQGLVIESHGAPPGRGTGGAPPSGTPDSGMPTDGDGPDASTSKDVLPSSGSQVRAVGWAAGGTLFAFEQYRDTKHDVTCRVQIAEDGVSRCLPSPAADVVFLDSECKHPIANAFRPACGISNIPKYGIYGMTPSGQCGIGNHVVSLAKVAARPSEVYLLSGEPTSCQPSQNGTSGGDFYEVVPTPPSEWVAYQREVVPLSADVGVEAWHGEDGSRIVGGFQMLPEKIPCSPLADEKPIGNSPSYCVPAARGVDAVDYFVDGTCTEFVSSGSRCNPPVIAARRQLVQCDPPHFSDLGKERTAESLFWQVPGILRKLSPQEAPCEAVPAGVLETENARYFEIGPEINPARYPSLNETWVGQGPILGARWTGNGTSTLFTSGSGTDARDARSSEMCNVIQGPEKAFCTYSIGATSADGLFADAECTKPLFAFDPTGNSTPDSCASNVHKPKWTVPVSGNTGCGPVDPLSPLQPVLDLHQGPIYADDPENPGTQCALADASSLSQYKIYDLGDQIDSASVFTEVTELDY